MTSSARRLVAATATVLAVALGSVACSDDDGGPTSAPATTPAAPAVRELPTRATFGTVTGRLPRPERVRLTTAVTKVVDGWFEAAYLGGRYPRTAFADAWPGFTPGARADARRDVRLMSNRDLGARIDGVTATKRRLRIDVLAVRKRPVGVTGRFVLQLRTSGSLRRAVRVQGSLYLTPVHGRWRVFGYDVTKGAVR